MKRIIYTQRVEFMESYQERRDCVDQRWSRLLFSCGFLPVPFPNDPDTAPELIKDLRPDGIVLTGGNDAPEREQTERLLLDYALRERIPVLGVCHGMQMIQRYFGGELVPVEGHVSMRHELEFEGHRRNVNSYHNLAVMQPPASFKVDARAEDGVVEAMSHCETLVRAVMWHPEREEPFSQLDKSLICSLMGGESK